MLVEPPAEVDVNVPGVMLILAAPTVTQLSVLMEPEVMPLGLAVKELISGLPAVFTVTVSVAVAEPAALLAVRVYVVVTVGLMLVEPLAAAEVYVPGEMLIFAAPAATQFSVLLEPELILAGFAVKEAIVGTVPAAKEELDEPQFTKAAQASRMRTIAQAVVSKGMVLRKLSLSLHEMFDNFDPRSSRPHRPSRKSISVTQFIGGATATIVPRGRKPPGHGAPVHKSRHLWN